MQETLAARVRREFEYDTALNRLRQSLSEEEQKALDVLTNGLRQYQVSADLASQLSSFEKVLLLMLLKQHQRLECLEFNLQRQAMRLLEMYIQQNDNDTIFEMGSCQNQDRARRLFTNEIRKS